MRLRSRARAGMSFAELMVSLVILGYLVMLAVPASENAVRRVQELESSAAIREMRRAIDRFQEDSLRSLPATDAPDAFPRSLEQLVEKRYLRRIPVDPLTGQPDWVVISTTDEAPPTDGFVSDGKDVFDVRTRAKGTTLEGVDYADL